MQWLRDGGYPLEYETARMLRLAGWYAEQGRHYSDPRKPDVVRETDIVAEAPITGPVRFLLVVECKVSEDNPWVVLTSPTTPRPVYFIVNPFLEAYVQKHKTPLGGLFPQDKPYGFSVVEVLGKSGRDRAYDAVEQVISAAQGLVPDERPHVLLWPVIVTTAQLFRVVTDDSVGNERLVTAEWARIRFHGASRPIATAVDIVTRFGLMAYAREMRGVAGEVAYELRDVPAAT